MKRFGADYVLQKRAVDAILTSRAAFPSWFSFGVFHGMVGSYMTSHHSYPLLDWLMRTGDSTCSTWPYGGILANWACITPSGTATTAVNRASIRRQRDNPQLIFITPTVYPESWEWPSSEILIAFACREVDIGPVSHDMHTLMPWSGFGFRAYIDPFRKGRLETARNGKSSAAPNPLRLLRRSRQS